MPFHLRIVQPTRLGRLGSNNGQAPREGSTMVLGSLLDVSSHTMLLIIHQLSDLSRHAENIFTSIHSQAAALGDRSAHLQHRLACLQKAVSHLDHRKVPVPVSNLDEESKWTVHYTAAWHEQENVFLPSSRPSCVDDLHREAKLNLKTVLRECDKLRRDGYRSSQYYSQGPTFSSSPSMVCTHYQEDDEEEERKFSVSSSEEEKLLPGKRPKTPVSHEFSDTHTNWTKSLPLPTPEEKMRQEAQAIHTDVIPINVSGENFDRQASFRRSLIHTDTVVRRPKKVKRRKTITGVPDNIQKELAGTGQIEFRGHSLHMPDDYNALESCRPSSQHIDTRDFSCQTDEIKVVPPSVRRIRAQKGQGIAALMSSSSGNMSTVSDSAGCSPHMNGDINFRSLPRHGARVCMQSLERKPIEPSQMQESFISLPRQLSKLQVDDSVVHRRSNPRSGSLQRPKSQEVRGTHSEVISAPACMVSPHAAYSTSVIPNAMLSSSSEVIAIHTSQSTGQLESKAPSHTKSLSRDRSIVIRDDHHSSNSKQREINSVKHSQPSNTSLPATITMISIADSSKSLNNTRNINTVSQAMPYRVNAGFNSHSQDSDTHSESSCSDGRHRNGSITSSINSAEPCFYDVRENDSSVNSKKPSSAVSGSPVSNMSSCSSERKGDSSSLYSVDHDGYYTSMRVDSGISTGSQNNEIQNPRYSVINIFNKKEAGSIDGRSNYSDKSLTRSISLKKPKKAPPPPSRTDSLRRPPKKNIQSNGQVLSETLIASLQQSLQLNLKGKTGSSPSQSPCSDYEDPWILRSRSQSTVSASSSGMSAMATNLYSICAVTPSQSETSSIKSEYADQWSYFIDYAQTPDEQPKTLATQSPNKSTRRNDYNACELSYGIPTSMPQVHSGLTKQNNASPEKPCRVTSPSSGYSSQSNTPTTLTPVPAVLKNASPGNGKNKMKPKVPERRSSLISSVSISSSSTSLSSNASDSVQHSAKKSTEILPPPHTPPTPPLTPDPPPPPEMDVVDIGNMPSSLGFPPPPPEATLFPSPSDGTLCLPQSQNTVKYAPLNCPPPPPPPLPVTFSHIPPLASQLNTKVLKSKMESTSRGTEDNGKFHNNKQEQLRSAVPLITAQALKMVHLKSVKKSSKVENEKLAEQVPDPKLQHETSSIFSRPSLVPSASLDLKSNVCIRENKNCNTPDEELRHSNYQSNTAKLTTSEISTEKPLQRHREDIYQTSAHNGSRTIMSEMSSLQETPNTSQSTPNASPNKKPPPVSKKPKLFLIVPPPQLDLAAEKIAQVSENVRNMPNASERVSIGEHFEEVNGCKATENKSEETVGLACHPEADLSSCKVGEGSPFTALSPVLEDQNQEEQPTMSEGVDTPDGKTKSPRCILKLPEEVENSDVFETEDMSSSPRQAIDSTESNEEVMTPTRPRTTEDLFALIHRSKRRVLGRKDSDDDRGRNHSPSPPVTPTGGVPNVSTFKQTGAIQRNIRKSSTSSDNFKALLLKKGSRSESGSRMSAAEMLKHTDPRFHRSRSDSSLELPDSPTLSSPKNRKAQEEWAKSEGLMPRSMSLSGTRYSRSRTPPSAASSKYNVRSRLQSSPMTVICEGEGEATDVVENKFSKMPLMCTKSLDRFHRADSEADESVDAEESNGDIHIDLMSRLLEGEDVDSLGEKS
ncbi:NHS-like protein 1 [Pelodytes ibericus]